MRKIVLAVILVSGFGMYAFAQTRPVSVTTVRHEVGTFSLEADSIQKSAPAQAESPMKLSGNVEIVFSGIRITADSAVFQPDKNLIELNGGTVRIELPQPPTSINQKSR